MDSPPASDSAVSRSADEEQDEEEQYHVHFDKNVKRGGSGMARVPRKRKSEKTPVSTTLKRKAKTFLDDDLDFGDDLKDSVLMGLDSLIAGDDADDVTNPFDFK